MSKDGRKEGRKEGRTDGRKDGRKEGRKEGRILKKRKEGYSRKDGRRKDVVGMKEGCGRTE
jgi:hypothetical protein